MNEKSPERPTAAQNRVAADAARLLNDSAIRDVARRAALPALQMQSLVGGMKKTPFTQALEKNRAALSAIRESQRRVQALTPIIEHPMPKLDFGTPAPVRTLELTRELVKQNELVVDALQAMTEQLQTVNQQLRDQNQESGKDYRVNVLTLRVTIASLILGVVAILVTIIIT